MSLLSENDATENSGLSWDPTGGLSAVDELMDSRIDRSSFYKDVFRPAWKALEDAAATLFLEWFSGSLNTIGQLVNWYNAKQTAKELKYYKQHPKRRPTPEALPIPLDAPIGLRKVMSSKGETGNMGSFAVETTESRTTAGAIKPLKKTNPWLEATKKQQCVLDIKPPPDEKPARKSIKAGKKSYKEEPNRGLDDIYTNPVNGFFSEDKDFTFKKPVAPIKKAVVPKLNTQTIAALIDAELDQILPKKRNNTSAEKSGGTSNPIMDGFFNWAELQTSGNQNENNGRELHDYELIPGLPMSQAEFTTAQDSNDQHIIEEEQESGLTVSSAHKLNHNGASIMLAKAKASNLEFKRQMPLYQEMKNEMSGADHMVRNNRILHNSISNLADSYFKKAAEEEKEQSNFY